MPFVSVIIPTYHDWDRLKLCLNALAQQSYPIDRFEVLVVNNDPGDQPPYKVAIGNVCLLEEAKPGSYAARNAAIRVAKGEIFAFTDSDCIPDQHWLKYAISAIQSGAERVGGAIALFSDGPDTNNFPTAFQRCTAFRQERNVANGWSVTANMIAKRHCFEVAGLFDGEMLSGGDQDWGRRAEQLNFNIRFSDDAITKHPIRASWSQLITKQKRLVGGAIRLNRKKSILALVNFLVRQLMPPFNAWKMIAFENRQYVLSVKIKAMTVALALKLYSAMLLSLLILGVKNESRF